MPNIDDRAAERSAGAAADMRHVKFQAQRHAGFDGFVGRIDADVGAVEFLVDEVRPFCLFGTNYAGRQICRQCAGLKR